MTPRELRRKLEVQRIAKRDAARIVSLIRRLLRRADGWWRMKTHRESFPEQYRHPMVGKLVFVSHQGEEIMRGTVARVVQSRFGQLAHFEGTNKAYRLIDCEYVTGDAPFEDVEKTKASIDRTGVKP